MGGRSAGPGFGFLLFLLFLGLKLGHVITWSWWWVFSPMWIPTALFLIFYGPGIISDAFGEARAESRYERERLERQRMARSADLALYDEWGKPRTDRS